MSTYKKTVTIGLDTTEFDKGISNANKRLKELDNEFKLANEQVKAYGQAQNESMDKVSYLSQKIEIQKQKVEDAKAKYDALMASQADTKKIDAADAALMKERITLTQLEGEYNKATAADVRFKNSLDEAKAKIADHAMALTACIAVVIALGNAYRETVNSAMDYAREIQQLSDELGLSTTKIQELEYVAQSTGASIDTLTSAYERMTKNMEKASSGTGTAASAFEALGVKVTDSQGRMRNAENVFFETIDALAQLESHTEKSQYAMDIFGNSAMDIIQIINMGSQGIRELATEMNGVLSQEDIKKLTDAKEAVAQLENTFEKVGNMIAADFAPVIQAIAEALDNIPAPVMEAIAVFASLTIGITAISVAAGIAIPILTGLAASGAAAAASMAEFVGPILIAAAAITAIIVVIKTLIELMERLAEAIKKVDWSAVSAWMTDTSGGYSTPWTSQLKPQHNARGTQSWRGGATWVGEDGPEIVDVPAGARIYNNKESNNIAGNTYNISMNVDITKLKSVNDVVDAVSNLGNSAIC